MNIAIPHRTNLSMMLLAAAIAAAGCGAAATPAAPSPAGQLSGTWSLISLEPAGTAEQATPAGARYAVTFNDGWLSARADCNSCSGVSLVTGETLTAGPALACTRAACPTMAFENVFTRLLGGDSTVALSGSTLQLSSARGVLRFTR